MIILLVSRLSIEKKQDLFLHVNQTNIDIYIYVYMYTC